MNPKITLIIQRFIFFMLLLSGFAQMPIFKRYYIADIPGFGWLAEYGVTHLIHYGFAILFTVIFFYRGTITVLENKAVGFSMKQWINKIPGTVLLFGIIATGFFLVSRNLPGYRFSANVITGLDIVHLGLVMAFLMFSLIVLIYRRFKPSQSYKGL